MGMAAGDSRSEGDLKRKLLKTTASSNKIVDSVILDALRHHKIHPGSKLEQKEKGKDQQIDDTYARNRNPYDKMQNGDKERNLNESLWIKNIHFAEIIELLRRTNRKQAAGGREQGIRESSDVTYRIRSVSRVY